MKKFVIVKNSLKLNVINCSIFPKKRIKLKSNFHFSSMSTEVFSPISSSFNIEPMSSKTNPSNLDLSNLQSTSSEEDRNQVMNLMFQRIINFILEKLQEQGKHMQEQEKIINEMSKSSNETKKNSTDIEAIQNQLKQNDLMYEKLIKTYESLKGKIVNLDNKISIMDTKFNKGISKLNDRMTQMDDKISHLETEISQMHSDIIKGNNSFIELITKLYQPSSKQ